MRLFQYWDLPRPPAEVAAWINDFKIRNPEFDHILFDRDAAIKYITAHYGSREVAAFRACAVPAMQADFIRLCAMDVHGGVYVDADNQSLKPLTELVAKAPRAMMFTWMGMINNGFLLFRRPGDCFVRACLKLTIENIEARRFRTEFTSTGPGVLNAIRVLVDPSSADEVLSAFNGSEMGDWGFGELINHARNSIIVSPELVESLRSITLINALAASPWIGADQPAYKQSDRHWMHWKGDIYK